MIDYNEFKRSVKEWLRHNPGGTMTELRDYCEEMIPPSQFSSHQWLLDQTVSWYRHILNHRELVEDLGDENLD